MLVNAVARYYPVERRFLRAADLTPRDLSQQRLSPAGSGRSPGFRRDKRSRPISGPACLPPPQTCRTAGGLRSGVWARPGGGGGGGGTMPGVLYLVRCKRDSTPPAPILSVLPLSASRSVLSYAGIQYRAVTVSAVTARPTVYHAQLDAILFAWARAGNSPLRSLDEPAALRRAAIADVLLRGSTLVAAIDSFTAAIPESPRRRAVDVDRGDRDAARYAAPASSRATAVRLTSVPR